MSKLDAAIEIIRQKYLRLAFLWERELAGLEMTGQNLNVVVPQLEQAISILESYPKWEPLIEAAKKMDKKMVLYELNYIESILEKVALYLNLDITSQIRALLEAIPEEEKKGKRQFDC
jgi:hypothetical protein